MPVPFIVGTSLIGGCVLFFIPSLFIKNKKIQSCVWTLCCLLWVAGFVLFLTRAPLRK